jgi:hypothetical protein
MHKTVLHDLAITEIYVIITLNFLHSHQWNINQDGTIWPGSSNKLLSMCCLFKAKSMIIFFHLIQGLEKDKLSIHSSK